MEGFPSGQREQTVNLSSMTSVVRIHHLPPKEPILIRVSVLFWCQVEWIRKPALRNVPVARFNRRGFAAAKRIHHQTGWQACGSATMGGNSQSRQAHAQSEGTPSQHAPIRRKERSFNDEIYQHRLFGTIYCRLRRYLVGAQNHTVRGRTLRLAKSRLRRLLAGRPLRWVSPFSIWHTRKIKRREHNTLSLNTAKGFSLPA